MGSSDNSLYGDFYNRFRFICYDVAITTLVVELNTTLSTIQTIIALYALIIASFMLFGSKLQDILGRKRTFLVGLTIYASGTIIATLSINAGILLIGWAVLEGIGAALILPATTTLVGASYEGTDRVTAFGIWGTEIKMERSRYSGSFIINSITYSTCYGHFITNKTSKLDICPIINRIWGIFIFNILIVAEKEN